MKFLLKSLDAFGRLSSQLCEKYSNITELVALIVIGATAILMLAIPNCSHGSDALDPEEELVVTEIRLPLFPPRTQVCDPKEREDVLHAVKIAEANCLNSWKRYTSKVGELYLTAERRIEYRQVTERLNSHEAELLSAETWRRFNDEANAAASHFGTPASHKMADALAKLRVYEECRYEKDRDFIRQQRPRRVRLLLAKQNLDSPKYIDSRVRVLRPDMRWWPKPFWVCFGEPMEDPD